MGKVFYVDIRNSEQSFTKKLKELLDWLIIRGYELYRIESFLQGDIVVTKNGKNNKWFVRFSIDMLMEVPSDYLFEWIEREFSRLEGER